MTPREQIAALLASALGEGPPPELPPRRARELPPPRTKKRRSDRRARRAGALERLTAAASRAASAAGEPYRPIRGIPARTWSACSAIVRDTSGRTAASALSTLPIALRHRARAELAPLARTLTGRYRIAFLVGLHQLSRPYRGRRRPGRVVDGYARGALCALLRSPATGDRLSVSRVYGSAINGAPIVPWLAERDLLRREQPGRGARGVVRGPSGYALGVYYLDGDALEDHARAESRPARRTRAPLVLAELLERPPD